MTAPRLDLNIPTAAWAEPLLVPSRYKGISGGRSKGASHFFAELAVDEMIGDPSLRFVCIREVQRSLRYSAKSLVESKIEALGVAHLFDVQRQEIRRRGGSGVMIFEGMQDHTADSIKSLEGFGRAWVEEAQNISKRSLDLLLPTIRAEGSEIWFSWNPDQPTDPVDKFFASIGAAAVHVTCTYLDNPFCPDVMYEEAARLKIADPDGYEHIWMGGYFLGGHGRVYFAFVNKPFPEGNVDASVHDHGGELYVGQDFNVNPMATVIAQRVVDECHVIDALEIPTSSTSEVVEEVKRLYPKRKVIFCPDPAGNARHTNAPVGQTDFSIIRAAGFEVRAPSSHCAVVDRINNTNAMLHDKTLQRRRLRIHPRCLPLLRAHTGLVYKEGTSIRDTTRGGGALLHISDALDYLLWQEFNVLTPAGKWGTSTFSA